MAIPDYQSLFLPFLEYLNDGEMRRLTEVRSYLSSHFSLTEEEGNSLYLAVIVPILKTEQDGPELI